MGLLDKSKETLGKVTEKTLELGDMAKSRAKESVLRGIELIPVDDVADLIIAATKKQEQVNQVLEARGSRARLVAASFDIGPPPAISFAIVSES